MLVITNSLFLVMDTQTEKSSVEAVPDILEDIIAY